MLTKPKELLVSKGSKEKTKIKLGNVVIGGTDVVMIAGPCAIESTESLIQIGMELKKQGVKILRASAYKPRSSPYSFQGHGLEGLKMHKKAQETHGLLIETEVMDPRDVEVAAQYVDILRVGSRNMQNFDLLKELGKCGKPVILKRGLSATIEEWLMSAEYILAHGNPHVILCERGIRTYETSTRNTLDLSALAVLQTKTHLPIIVDPSHAAGRKDIIGTLSAASVAAGCDGLMIEVHPNPQESWCDRDQALSSEEYAAIVTRISPIAKAIGRRIG